MGHSFWPWPLKVEGVGMGSLGYYNNRIFRMHTIYIDLYEVLSSVIGVNVLLYQKMQK